MLCGYFFSLQFTTGVVINLLSAILLSFFVLKFLYNYLLLATSKDKGKGKATLEDLLRDQQEQEEADHEYALELQEEEFALNKEKAKNSSSSSGNGGTPKPDDPEEPKNSKKTSNNEKSSTEEKENLDVGTSNSLLPADNNTSNLRPSGLKRKHSDLDSEDSEDHQSKKLKESLNTSGFDNNGSDNNTDEQDIFCLSEEISDGPDSPVAPPVVPNYLQNRNDQSTIRIDEVRDYLDRSEREEPSNSPGPSTQDIIDNLPNIDKLHYKDAKSQSDWMTWLKNKFTKEDSTQKEDPTKKNDDQSDDTDTDGGDAGGGE